MVGSMTSLTTKRFLFIKFSMKVMSLVTAPDSYFSCILCTNYKKWTHIWV